MDEPQTGLEAVTQLIIEIFRTNRLLLDAGDQLARPAGLSSARWQVLGVIEHGPIPVANVARLIGLTRQSVQQTADALAADGLISFADNPHHRRAKLMVISAAGSEALAFVQREQQGWAARLAAGQDPAALATALAVLRRLRADLESAPPAE